MICKRCEQNPARFVILTDLMRMPVCKECAAESRNYPELRVGVLIENPEDALSTPDLAPSPIGNHLGSEFKLAGLSPFQRVIVNSIK